MNSIGTNTSCIGAVHALPTGKITRAATRNAKTVSPRASSESGRLAWASAATSPATTRNKAAAAASVISIRLPARRSE
jgi:hypothetical protein